MTETTTTLPPAAPKKAKPRPATKGYRPRDTNLALPADNDGLSPEVAKACDAYRARVERFEAAWNDLQDRRIVLLGQGGDMVLSMLWDAAAEMRQEHADLELELNDLAGLRRALCQRLVPELKTLADTAATVVESAKQAERDRLASLGVTWRAMPAAETSEGAARQQLEFQKVNMADGVLVAIEKFKAARERARQAAGIAGGDPPTLELRWSTVTGSLAQVANVCDLQSVPRQRYALRLNGEG